MKKPVSVIFDEITSDEKLMSELITNFGLLRSDIIDSLTSTSNYLEKKYIECDRNHLLNTFYKSMNTMNRIDITVSVDRRLWERYVQRCVDCNTDPHLLLVKGISQIAHAPSTD